MSHELVKGYGRKNISPRCIIKIDMQNSYDSVEWRYIEQVLRALNFPEIFVRWIVVCISIVTYSVLRNGRPTDPFEAKKGLRQGDPLSPFLFVLAMEYLSRSLKTLKEDKKFKYHPKCTKFNLEQLRFADDLLLFCRGEVQSVQILHQHF
ncbi:secreted RxLR effector protein 78-like [Nicotiana sylvestris]|uniref:secreted RxLR effector protein 78-like n=1 Tax=Nicotiana sylvestris TaxID=4096 RepID=UPI00388CCAF8